MFHIKVDRRFSRGVGAMRYWDGSFFMRFKVRYKKRASIAKKVAKCFNVKPKIIDEIVRKYVETVVESLPEFKSASLANIINIKLETKLTSERVSVGFKTIRNRRHCLTFSCAPTRAAEVQLETAAIQYSKDKRAYKNALVPLAAP
jgi:hypothetical protein